MSDIYVFCGPTISAQEAAKHLDAVFLPPVAQGDIIRVARKKPKAIGIIDGYFERIPAVWHKEILWAMEQGIHVYGASSMGALRAAELDNFGMQGLGWIYEQFTTGNIIDDDEVAVAHASADYDFKSTSDAMVNIRQTVNKALALQVCTQAEGEMLLEAAKSLFYPERNYGAALKVAVKNGLAQDVAERLGDWIKQNKVDQKQLDGIALLETLKRDIQPELADKQVDYRFNYTEYWGRALKQAGDLKTEVSHDSSQSDQVDLNQILEELRMQPAQAVASNRAAMMRIFVYLEAQRQGFKPGNEDIQATAVKFRQSNGLLNGEDLQTWCQQNSVSSADFAKLMTEQAYMQWAEKITLDGLESHLQSQLIVDDLYQDLRGRALEKHRALQAVGLPNPGIEDTGLDREALHQWFNDRHEGEYPINELGFETSQQFFQAVSREYCYQKYCR